MVFSEVVHSQIDDLQGVKIMLAERLERWMQEKEAQFMQSGMEKGLQQGMEKGMEKGEALALQRLLIRRFGPLPPAIQARLNRASTQEIEAWLDAVIDAPSLEAIFTKGKSA
jgi:flagellar biosynthesis/type III secretory pathway protein FliH